MPRDSLQLIRDKARVRRRLQLMRALCEGQNTPFCVQCGPSIQETSHIASHSLAQNIFPTFFPPSSSFCLVLRFLVTTFGFFTDPRSFSWFHLSCLRCSLPELVSLSVLRSCHDLLWPLCKCQLAVQLNTQGWGFSVVGFLWFGGLGFF